VSLRRTRIICTLGPSSSSRATLRALIAAGMDIARVNFSHGTEEEHRETVEAVRAVSTQMGRHIALLQDLQGPKIRTGWLAHAPIRLRRGEPVTLTARPVVGDETLIPVSHQAFLRSLIPDEKVLLDDGEIELRIRSVKGTEALCTVVRGGVLGERKGVTAPNCPIHLPALTPKDLADLRLGAELRFDYLALSFVRSAQDLLACRRAMRRVSWKVPLIAKLERPQALLHLDGILSNADGVMVARGDLGVELSLAEVPAAQKDIIERANLRGVPVITATEMLESMVTSNRPTRAEASDVANAIWDGTDAVMLSQETSVGAHPVESVRAMAAICRAAEGHPSYQRARPVGTVRGSVGSAIAHSAATVADELGAAAIVAFTETGSTALRVSKKHPTVPVIAASPHPETLRRTALYAGVVPLLVEHGTDTDDLIAKASEAAIRSGFVRRHDRVVIVAGVAKLPGQTNLLKVVAIQ
jgi:pyruvate kinase